MTAALSADSIQRKPPPVVFRWLVLLVISIAMAGNYYIYDSISPLADVLTAQLNFTDSDIGLLQGIYSFPNIIMVLIGGLIIDRIGTRKSIILFSFLCLAGAALTASSSDLTTMAAGRLLFGLGAESQIVAVTTTLAKWFKGKELSFAFGLNLTLARLGSFLALNSPTWAKSFYTDWQYPLFIAVAFGVLTVLAALLYFYQDLHAETMYDLGDEGETDKVSLKDIFKFGKSYWLVVALCFTFYSGVFPFQTFAIKFFQNAHGVTRENAGFLSSMLTLFAMIFTPLFGLLVDRIGKRSLFMMFGSILLIPGYLLMAYTDTTLYVPMIMMGIAFSLIPAVMWPSVAYIVEQSKLGTAYGLMTMIQSIGLTGFNFLIGWANDSSGASATNPEGYVLGMWIFSILGLFGVLFALLLRRNEMGPSNHGLETITVKSAKSRAAAAIREGEVK
jgi:MFS family permease